MVWRKLRLRATIYFEALCVTFLIFRIIVCCLNILVESDYITVWSWRYYLSMCCCWLLKMFKMPIINISHKQNSMNYHMLDLFKLIAKNSLIVFNSAHNKTERLFSSASLFWVVHVLFFLFTLKRYCLSTTTRWGINQHIFNLIIGNFEAFTIRLKFSKYYLIIFFCLLKHAFGNCIINDW